MSDQDILAKWRARYPHINLTTAKALEKLERRFSHLRPDARSVNSDHPEFDPNIRRRSVKATDPSG